MVTYQGLASRETGRAVRFHAPHHNALGVERLQVPERPYPALQSILHGREEEGLAAGGLHLGQSSIAGSIRHFYSFDVVQFGPTDSIQEVAPALRLLRWLDRLDEGEAGTKFAQGAYPVGAVEDEVTIFVRGDYYGVALLTFGFDASPQTGQAVLIVGFMEDKAPEVYKKEVFEGGDHVLWW